MSEEKQFCKDCQKEIFMGQGGRCIYCHDIRINILAKASPESLLEQVDKMTHEWSLMKLTLQYYSSESTYKSMGHSQIDADNTPILLDKGKKARETLEKIT